MHFAGLGYFYKQVLSVGETVRTQHVFDEKT